MRRAFVASWLLVVQWDKLSFLFPAPYFTSRWHHSFETLVSERFILTWKDCVVQDRTNNIKVNQWYSFLIASNQEAMCFFFFLWGLNPLTATVPASVFHHYNVQISCSVFSLHTLQRLQLLLLFQYDLLFKIIIIIKRFSSYQAVLVNKKLFLRDLPG